MSEYDEIPGQQFFDIAGEPQLPIEAPRSRRRALIAGGTAVVTGLAFAGWGVSSALTTGQGASGFPRVAALTADSTVSASAAAAAVDKAVVDITSTDAYSGEVDAGTGMVITSTGDVLTNNHVVDDATSVTVRLPATGKTYKATVLGTDATHDIALLKLKDATGLATIPVADATSVTTGIAVAAIGNALGKGGAPAVVTGRITGTGRSITASDGDGSAGEQLSGMLETDADIVSGDSGGPLVDSSGQVIGMDTAAESGANGQGFEDSAITSSSDGYAIPITTALTIAREIAAGKSSATVVIGTPGFIGVQIASNGGGGGFGGGFGGYGGYSEPSVSGAAVAGVVSGGPAAAAGIEAGDTITAVDGTAVTSAEGLKTLLGKRQGGDRVSIKWTDSAGGTHQATVTLIAGPAA